MRESALELDQTSAVNTTRAHSSDSQLIGLIKRLALSFAGVTIAFLGFACALLWFSADLVDQSSTRQSIYAVENNLQRIGYDLGVRNKDLGWWQKTIDNVISEQNQAWLEDNFRGYLFNSFGVNEVLVLSDKGEPVYAERKGVEVSIVVWHLQLPGQAACPRGSPWSPGCLLNISGS